MAGPTIYDVAKAAGVATSTVSRAFSTPGRVNERTRERILAAAEKLGYRPNPHAKALFSGQHRTVAMVVSDITNPHYFEMIRGAEMRTRAADYTLVLVNAEESARIEHAQIERLLPAVDGFMLAASRLPDAQLQQFAGQAPLVLMNRELDGLASVVIDHDRGCRLIIEHLASLGHERLAYLGGPRSSWMAARRWRALSQSAKGLGLDIRHIGPFTPTTASGGAAADSALPLRATALIAHNDLLAIGVCRRLVQRGIGVPDDVSVVGFDDIFASELFTPALTTLGGPYADAGRISVDLLLDWAGKGRVPDRRPRVRLPADLILRASTAAPPIAPA